jgi:predicted SprT family Zn-dependent metalloprotease
MTLYKDGDVKIYLNKNVMRESINYMLDTVIAHEYAHALMFRLGDFSREKKGHSDEWKRACINLGGKGCAQYVNKEDIIMDKLAF